MTTIRRHVVGRRAAATATMLLVPTLAACGFGAQTNQQYQSAAGTDNRTSVVQILNAAIVIPKVGDTNGVFVGSFVNNSTSDPAEGLTGAAANGVSATVESVAVTSPSGSPAVEPKITLAAGTSYDPQPVGQAGDQGIPLTIPATVPDGGYVQVSFVIDTAGSSTQTVTMAVPVFPADNSDSVFAPYLPTSTATTPSATKTDTAAPGTNG